MVQWWMVMVHVLDALFHLFATRKSEKSFDGKTSCNLASWGVLGVDVCGQRVGGKVGSSLFFIKRWSFLARITL